ncbi:10878_t:CDS:2, partial [Paraglomus brasilianum]
CDSQCKALCAAAQIHSPSKYGKKPESDVNICHHQPDSCTDIPVQFYHKVFANFLELWRNQDDYGITEEKKNILELASSLSTPLKDEEKHAQIFRNWLTYNDLESYIYKTPKIESDGTHFGCYNQQCFLLVNTEVKTDYGTTCRAYHQSTATTTNELVHQNRDKIISQTKTCFPSSLLILEGVNLTICGAVFSDVYCVDKFIIIPFDAASYNDQIASDTACTLQALKICVKELSTYLIVIEDRVQDLGDNIDNICIFTVINQLDGRPTCPYIPPSNV